MKLTPAQRKAALESLAVVGYVVGTGVMTGVAAFMVMSHVFGARLCA